MNKILFVFLIAFLYGPLLWSQDYRFFELDLGLGYAIPGEKVDGGLGLYVEPRLNLSDNISVGVRAETAATSNDFNLSNINDEDDLVGFDAIASFMGTLDFYKNFTPRTRLFVGGGVGLYSTGEVEETISGTRQTIDGATGLAVYPRAGFELGHFRTGIGYNILSGDGSDASYLMVTAGFVFGGGVK